MAVFLLPPVWILVLAAVPLLLAFLYYRFEYAPLQVLKRNGFVGPTPSFFFGNYHDRLREGSVGMMETYHKQYGPIVGYYVGKVPFVLTSDLELIKLITVKDWEYFMDRASAGDIVKKEHRPSGLLHSSGETWRASRRALTPTFSSFKMKAMAPIIKTGVDTLVSVFQEHADTDKTCNVSEAFGNFTLETIIATGFGRRINVQEGESDELSRAAAMMFSSVQDGAEASMALMNVIMSNFPWLDYILPYFFRNSERSKAVSVIHKAVHALIQQRRKDPEPGKYKDFLQMMIDAHIEEGDSKRKLTDQEIADHSVVFMLAGYETTSTALGYIAYLLALNPRVQEKLQADIDAYLKENPDVSMYQAAQDLEYLDMVVQESLRVYPPVPHFQRTCSKEYKYKDATFTPGVRVMFCTSLLQMDPQYWGEEPEKFDPLRFSAEEKAKRPQLCYMPFGSGPRSCIGQRLSLLEAKIALIGVLKKLSFVRAPDTEDFIKLFWLFVFTVDTIICTQTRSNVYEQVPLKLITAITRTPVNGVHLKMESRQS